MARLLIAKPGGNVSDATKDLVFDSNEDYMIILQERTDTANGSGDITINHNLGYNPAFYTFFEQSPNVWGKKLESGLGGDYSDNNNIYIKADPGQRVRTVIWSNSQNNSIGTGRNNAFGKLKISKAGYDASKETDLRKFVFASGNGIFKIKENKTFTVTVNVDGSGNSNDSITYAHGLGYVPQVYVFLQGIQIPIFVFQAAGQTYSIDFTVDSTNIIVSVQSSGNALLTGDTFTFNVQILLDKIN